MNVLKSIFNCQNCGKKLWVKYYKLPDGRAVCPKCFDFFIRTDEIEKLKEKKMGGLESIINCQNFNKNLWVKYYKLPDGRAVCPKCFDMFIQTNEIEKLKESKKDL